MHHHGHLEHAGLLPLWLRAAWVAAFAVIAVVHLHHAWVMNGQRRYWHAGHILMAAAMAHMYLPHATQVFPAAVGVTVFSVAAAVSATAAVWVGLRTRVVNPLWALATVEMTVMIYMFLPTGARSVLLSGVLAAYLAGVGVLWALGRWDRYYRHDHTTDATPEVRAGARLGARALALRASLATMTAGMAYMLLAM